MTPRPDGYVYELESSSELPAGTIVNDRYEILTCLGAGSMGRVYSCRHLELSSYVVAMKVLYPRFSKDQKQAARFRNEIVASYAVSNPHVVRTYEYLSDGQILAYTMEYVEGGTLATWLSQEGAMPIAESQRIIAEICSGVQAIHDAGIIHRDLKPGNILLTEEGKVKIADFGIARRDKDQQLFEKGSIVGTIEYISPEQLRDGESDIRSDIYAIGVIAYELISGVCPFQRGTMIEVMAQRLKNDVKPLHLVRPDCPLELSRVIMDAMSIEKESRPCSAVDMAKAFHQQLVDDENLSGFNGQTAASIPAFFNSGFEEKDGTKRSTGPIYAFYGQYEGRLNDSFNLEDSEWEEGILIRKDVTIPDSRISFNVGRTYTRLNSVKRKSFLEILALSLFCLILSLFLVVIALSVSGRFDNVELFSVSWEKMFKLIW